MELFGVLTMNVIKWKNVLYIVLCLSAITSIFTWFVGEKVLSIGFVIECIGNSSTIIGVATPIFCLKLWKYKIFQGWLVLIPDLNGIWQGTIKSNWINSETNQKIAPIETRLYIKQSLFKISCVLKTSESTSRSIVASFVIEPENQVEKLAYIYQNDSSQKFRDKSPIHYGTTSLDIIKNKDNIKLIGSYWTDRNTSGDLEFNKKI